MNILERFLRKFYEEAGDEGAASGGDAGATGDTGTVLTDGDAGETSGDAGTALTGDGKPAEGSEDEAAAAASDDKTGDKAGDKAGEEGKGEVPDTYADFVLPEGMQLDEAALGEATPIFKEMGLTQEQAQKVVDLYAKQVQAGSQKQLDDFNQLVNGWRETAKADKEFGGEHYDENVAVARTALNKYGTPELKQLLNDYGIGDNPEVIRFMVRVGKTLTEDKPGSLGGNHSETPDRVELMYGKQPTK